MSALLEATGLVKTFANGVKAVDGVDLHVAKGETLGVVGESGCGKSTTAKLVLRLATPDAGSIRFEGADLLELGSKRLRQLRARLQVVPQNPQTSLNPRLTIRQSIQFNLRAHGGDRTTMASAVPRLLERVGLAGVYAERFPHELSGGQLQRVAIARALATEPSLVVCDEAVSALDKSIQAQVLNLLVELQRDTGIAFLFISHDLAVVEHISDRVAVMYLGRVVEEAPSDVLWRRAAHPYTLALLASTPGRDKARVTLAGDPPSPANPPSGCTFRTRCPVAVEACAGGRPPLVEIAPGHRVACVHHTAAVAPPTTNQTLPNGNKKEI
jgi:peptide/nickel transport system ATP-binding protein/oligopeptide transport system ATP-binding protein